MNVRPIENGKIVPEAAFEVGIAPPGLRYYGALVLTEYGRVAEWEPGHFSLLVREPIGVAAGCDAFAFNVRGTAVTHLGRQFRKLDVLEVPTPPDIDAGPARRPLGIRARPPFAARWRGIDLPLIKQMNPEHREVDYATRISANKTLEPEIEDILFRPPGRPSRKLLVRYKSFRYQAESWTTPRRILAKVEHHQGELCVWPAHRDRLTKKA